MNNPVKIVTDGYTFLIDPEKRLIRAVEGPYWAYAFFDEVDYGTDLIENALRQFPFRSALFKFRKLRAFL